MAPTYPDEVDVFTVPHSRMKLLVHKYLDTVSSTNFSNVQDMTNVLEKLCHTFHEFKTHEQIENRFIMRRLKEKLTALSITDASVCNCHSDNRLTEMLSLVLDGYRWAQRDEHERVKYGRRLLQALEDFTQVFLPHMKEEEEVFQPMLIEYFTYEELKELKVKVIQKHMENAEECEKVDVPVSEVSKTDEADMESRTSGLPDEVMLNIFSYLSPRDLARCAQVSTRWNVLALDPSLWSAVYPVQWAAGDWSFHPSLPDEDDEQCKEEVVGSFFSLDDEDADVDESSDSETSDSEGDTSLQQALREVRIISGLVKHVLKRVGSGVRVCHLAHSRGISSSLVHKILKLCPNLHTLNLAHTRITDAAFKEFGLKGKTGQLEYLDLTACENITDATLFSLARHSAQSDDDSQLSVSSVSCCPAGTTCSTLEQDSVVCDGSSDDERLSSLVDSFVSVPPAPVSVDVDLSHPEFELRILETESLMERDPSFTDLSLLELCDLNRLEQYVCNQTSGEESRSCCQTRDIFSSSGRSSEDPPSNVQGSYSSGKGSVAKTECCSGSRGCEGADDGGDGKELFKSGSGPHALHRLRFLSLNGCYQIGDSGLRFLSERGGLPYVQHLDLSGCLKLTGTGVARLVEACPTLDHAHLFYCDNLYPDPFPTTASGCRNLQCCTRICCRTGE